MKIKEPIKGTSKAIRRFNSWLEYQQKEGLLYVHLSLSIEEDTFFGKKHFMRHFPKLIRNIWSKRYIDKVLNEFIDIQEGIDNGSIKTRPFTEEL